MVKSECNDRPNPRESSTSCRKAERELTLHCLNFKILSSLGSSLITLKLSISIQVGKMTKWLGKKVKSETKSIHSLKKFHWWNIMCLCIQGKFQSVMIYKL